MSSVRRNLVRKGCGGFWCFNLFIVCMTTGYLGRDLRFTSGWASPRALRRVEKAIQRASSSKGRVIYPPPDAERSSVSSSVQVESPEETCKVPCKSAGPDAFAKGPEVPSQAVGIDQRRRVLRPYPDCRGFDHLNEIHPDMSILICVAKGVGVLVVHRLRFPYGEKGSQAPFSQCHIINYLTLRYSRRSVRPLNFNKESGGVLCTHCKSEGEKK